MRTSGAFAPTAALGLSLLAGCADGTEFPGIGGEGPGTPPAVAGDWDCVGSVEWPRTRPVRATLAFRAARPFKHGDHALKACNRGDGRCLRPVDTATLLAAEDGEDEPIALLEVPLGSDGWDGYVEFTGPGHMPILAFEVPPVTGHRFAQDLPRDAFSPYLELVAQAVDVSLDPSRGAITFDVVDCANQPAEGASVTVDVGDGATAPVYFDAYAPVQVDGVTDSASGALGMLLNVPAGRAKLTVRVGEPPRWVSEVSVFTRAGALTTVHLPPSPGPQDPGVIGAP